MLEPRESDIPALFLVLVVFPLVAYILLGRWSDAAKKKERISLLAELAAEEALRAEAMAAARVIPVVSPIKNGLHVCARCFGPATTRCSRCKLTRYCSGTCQILHWRQTHKEECLQLESTSCSSPDFTSCEDSFLFSDAVTAHLSGYNTNQADIKKSTPDSTCQSSMSDMASRILDCDAGYTSQGSMMGRKSIDKRSRKSSREPSRRDKLSVSYSTEETYSSDATNSPLANYTSQKDGSFRTIDSGVSEEIVENHNVRKSRTHINEEAIPRSITHESCKHQGPHKNMPEAGSNNEFYDSSYAKYGKNVHEIETEFVKSGGNSLGAENLSSNETAILNCYSETRVSKEDVTPITASNSQTKINLPQSRAKVSGERLHTESERKEHVADESKSIKVRGAISTEQSSGVAGIGIMKMMGLKKSSKLPRHSGEQCVNKHKKMKMIFPYEEFMKFFQSEVYDLSPRGLLNCGNSCYANAVLQCLTCTKPLITYLLQRSHSKACCGKDWCLTCELEQHVMALRNIGGPLSPSRILSHMRNINCQIGDGSQEDAHEFLRLLIASMQSICLEGLGGESRVDPRLQETTFIQHAFGGHLQSKVKCMRCYHESERYENIMDLTLEIYGWVESLEDALTQFTTPEDLDGENMYRCGRCAEYVRARKQLSIHEAPNILTIVLKRFKEGSYGKINKCITFPEMLDMVPFMTGMGDIPPLYMLYAVVVHLDTLNASFSGHYVSYVKDLRGNWSRIDDTEVRPVPMSEVMSEGAYILFYMRSCPRPQRGCTEKVSRQQVPKDKNSSRPLQTRPSEFIDSHNSPDLRPKSTIDFGTHTSNGLRRSPNSNMLPVMERYSERYSDPFKVEFSDVTSSDWSLFTSSDEASFTTESTRDSFSTVDYTDTCNADPFSIFNTFYCPDSSSCNSVACRMFANNRSETRFVSEEKGYVLGSYLSSQPPNRVQKGEKEKDSTTENNQLDTNCSMSVKCGNNPKYSRDQTSGHCIL